MSPVGNRAASGRPEKGFFGLDALSLDLFFRQAYRCHFGVGIGDAGDHAGVASSSFSVSR